MTSPAPRRVQPLPLHQLPEQDHCPRCHVQPEPGMCIVCETANGFCECHRPHEVFDLRELEAFANLGSTLLTAQRPPQPHGIFIDGWAADLYIHAQPPGMRHRLIALLADCNCGAPGDGLHRQNCPTHPLFQPDTLHLYPAHPRMKGGIEPA
jgi:hypothetical protein